MRRLAIVLAVSFCACGGEEDEGVLDTEVHPLLAALGNATIAPNGVGSSRIEPNGVGEGTPGAQPGAGNPGGGNPGGGNPGGGNPGGGNPGGGNPGGGRPPGGGGGSDCQRACNKLEECGSAVANCVDICETQAPDSLVQCILNTPCAQLNQCN